MAKKLLSLQPVVRTRRYYNRVRLIKQQTSFQGLAKPAPMAAATMHLCLNFWSVVLSVEIAQGLFRLNLKRA